MEIGLRHATEGRAIKLARVIHEDVLLANVHRGGLDRDVIWRARRVDERTVAALDRWRGQPASSPPSTTSSVPVTYEASSEAKYSTMPDTS